MVRTFSRYRSLFSIKWMVFIGLAFNLSIHSSFSYAETPTFVEPVLVNEKEANEQANILISKFTQLKKNLSDCENRSIFAVSEILALLAEFNTLHGSSYTLHDLITVACANFKDTPIELQQQLTNMFQMFMANSEINCEHTTDYFATQAARIQLFGYKVYMPWEWNWFGWNKKDGLSSSNVKSLSIGQLQYPGQFPVDDRSIPDDLIICGIEFLSAAMLALIPFPLAQAAAGILAADGVSRGIQGLKEMSNQNQNHF